jgi:hypothetical protein
MCRKKKKWDFYVLNWPSVNNWRWCFLQWKPTRYEGILLGTLGHYWIRSFLVWFALVCVCVSHLLLVYSKWQKRWWIPRKKKSTGDEQQTNVWIRATIYSYSKLELSPTSDNKRWPTVSTDEWMNKGTNRERMDNGIQWAFCFSRVEIHSFW